MYLFPTGYKRQRMAYPCAFCLSFGREARTVKTALETVRNRKPTMRPLAFTDVSRSRIEEHYVTSRPAKWIEYQRKLEKHEGSNETNAELFDANKLKSHFRRVQNSSVKTMVSRDVGDLIKSLYEKDKAYATDDPEVRSIAVDSVGLGDRRGCDECKELLESEQWFDL
jgi:hypothetical protein